MRVSNLPFYEEKGKKATKSLRPCRTLAARDSLAQAGTCTPFRKVIAIPGNGITVVGVVFSDIMSA